MKNNVELRREICILTIENVSKVYTVHAMNLRYNFTRIRVLIYEFLDHMRISEHNVN